MSFIITHLIGHNTAPESPIQVMIVVSMLMYELWRKGKAMTFQNDHMEI